MRILAIDVGMGTQDILLYDDSWVPENSVKMVFPSMTQILAKRVAASKEDLCFHGSTMGGGPLAYAIKNHIRKGFKVVMTESSARSLRDNLEQVREMGVEIVADDEVGEGRGKLIETRDVDFPFIKRVLAEIGESFDFDSIGVAVQDHGYAEDKSDREFRFDKFREALEKDGKLYSLGFYDPPAHYTRMSSLVNVINEHHAGRAFIVDSKIAAMAGALYGIKERPAITIDIGNGHTTAALMDEGMEVLGLFEHHTHMLKKRTLEDYLRRFAAGELTNEEVFSDGGHGCYSRRGLPIEKVKRILATGPKRKLLIGSPLKVTFANPMGDVMMAGPMGIVDMIKSSAHFQGSKNKK
jgi:uncharacterized protein (DUF1786 family)